MGEMEAASDPATPLGGSPPTCPGSTLTDGMVRNRSPTRLSALSAMRGYGDRLMVRQQHPSSALSSA